ncbi:hypothetical protein GCM10010124_38530 [Pilimelia terevasa]|uniref:Uncharacterized protein n=1 Tax=Pilimelia terevasa TaxID=53372 RepID=A0A8J3BVQ8_9ACTN|nr:hypothetical protein [Pilimelia terevasa]GGK42025.1 hypothetical protein GCM10010124_38530 [Pilimelia terevasa]
MIRAGSSTEATAAAIYGVIVGAAVMAAAPQDSAAAVVLSVAATLVIYWAAERFARMVAARIHEGRRPPWPVIRAQLSQGWELLTASALPVAVLVAARLLGAPVADAVTAGLVCSTVLLGGAGWQIGADGRLTAAERAAAAALVGGLGIGMVVLKTLLH